MRRTVGWLSLTHNDCADLANFFGLTESDFVDNPEEEL
jgi:hypothetical protein